MWTGSLRDYLPYAAVPQSPSGLKTRPNFWAVLGRWRCLALGLAVACVLILLSPSRRAWPYPGAIPQSWRPAARPDRGPPGALGAKALQLARDALALPAEPRAYQIEGLEVLTALVGCRLASSCTQRQHEVVLLRSDHFGNVKEGLLLQKASGTSGEAIWADSFLWGLEQRGYPHLVFSPRGSGTAAAADSAMARVYALLRSLDPGSDPVKLVIGDYLSVPQCAAAPDCLQTPAFPDGIPWHKLFIWNAFGTLNGGHRYGAPWALTFFPFPPSPLQPTQNFTFIGLTLEPRCAPLEVTPAADRSHSAWILGKDRAYFSDGDGAWPADFWSRATAELGPGFTFTGGTTAAVAGAPGAAPPVPPGVADVGPASRADFLARIGRSRAMIGLGNPKLSSSPLEALCLGVPFINPVGWRPKGWRDLPREDRAAWMSQHRYLQRFDEPWVYNVDAGDYDGFVDAVRRAVANPIGRWVPEELKVEPYLQRIDEIIHRDWKAQADAQDAAGDIRGVS